MFNFEQYPVYKSARRLLVAIDRFCKCLPDQEKFVLKDQIRRASLSVVLNIAEGYSRTSPTERKHFLNIALGSVNEVVGCLDVATDLGYISETQREELYNLAEGIAKQLNALIFKS